MDFDLKQFGDIPPVSRDDWEAAVAKALGTQSLDRLRAVTADGVPVPPLSQPRPDRAPLEGRGAGSPWSIVQRVLLHHAGEANTQILDELAGGADAIDLVLPSRDAAEVGRRGHEDLTDKLIRALSGVYLDMVTVHLTASIDTINAGKILAKVVAGLPDASKGGCLRIAFDPAIHAVRTSASDDMRAAEIEELSEIIPILSGCNYRSSFLSSNGQFWHARGATESQQIAIAIATGLACLRMTMDGPLGKLEPERIIDAIEFRLVADQNQFVTIGKLRAFRRLWALVLDELGLPNRSAFVHAETAWRMQTRRDPWVNILRSTIACFAAAVGGADAITTRPHTELLGGADPAARRLSRNVQTVLMDECNLHRVADPAAGSGGIEALTDALAEAAWDEVRRIEGEGGIVAAARSGALFARIDAADAARSRLVATRRLPITGTSTYPFLAERAPEASGTVMPPPGEDVHRLSEPYERLRDRSDAAFAAAGVRPRVFLANLGPVSAFTARATFAKNLFEAGGIEAVQGPGAEDADAVVASWRASGAPIACLCSDDATYGRLAGTNAAALASAGASVLLAGRPKEAEADLRAAGVSRFIYDGMDVLECLEALHAELATPAAA